MPSHVPPQSQKTPTSLPSSSVPVSAPSTKDVATRPLPGNQGMLKLLRMASGSAPPADGLKVSSPDDPAEREAERVAAEVMRMPDNGAVAATSSTSPVIVRRKCAACEDEEEKVQRSATAASPGQAPPIVSQVLSQPGRPLSEATRSFFEPRMGADFSKVRIHDNSEAAQSAGAVRANAFTVGNAIVFNSGQYAPDYDVGRHLLAHELAHVVQSGTVFEPDSIHREVASGGMTSAEAPMSVPGTSPVDGEVPSLKGDAAENETLHKIATILNDNFWVGPDQESELERLWKTFQGRMPGLLRKSPLACQLYIESLDRGAEIEYLGDTEAIRERFLSDVKETAVKYMDGNNKLIDGEIDRLGLKQLGPVFTDQQRQGIDEIHSAAPDLKRAEDYRSVLLSMPVGYQYETVTDGLGHITVKNDVHFNPLKPPVIPNEGDERPPRASWDETNRAYLKNESAISGLKIKFPALAALQSNGTLDTAVGDDSMAIRSAILSAFNTVQGNIQRTRERLANGELNPLDLQPIHGQFFAGQKGPSMTAWNGQYDRWVANELLSHHESVEFWKAMGIGTAAAAAFIVAEFVTAGWATVFVASGVTLGGIQAANSWDKYLAIADASKTSLNDANNLVGSGQASEALFTAVLDSVFFFIDAYGAAAKGMKGAASTLGKGVKASGKEAAEKEVEQLVEKEGRDLAKREGETLAEQASKTAAKEGGPAGRELLSAEVEAEARSATGARIVITKNGKIFRCASPCSELAKRFERVLDEVPGAAAHLDELERRSIHLAELGEKAGAKEVQELAEDIADFERQLAAAERKFEIADEFAADQAHDASALSSQGVRPRGAYRRSPYHHLIPQKFLKNPATRDLLERRGINIDDLVIQISEGDHSATHSVGWNSDWDAFFKRYPNASRKRILDFVEKMRVDYKLTQFPVESIPSK